MASKEVPRAYINNYTNGLNRISETGRANLLAALEAVDYSDMTRAIDEVVTIMEEHCGLSARAAAEMAGYFYRGMSLYQTGQDAEAVIDTGHKAIATEKATRGIAQFGVNGNFPSMWEQLTNRLDYEVKKAAGETVMQSARADKRRPRFARVPYGSETCSFCIMLASRGPVYWSAKAAGEENHYHANCDCRIVPVWGSVSVMTENGGIVQRGGASIEGYDPDFYYDAYLDMVRDGKKWKSNKSWSEYKDNGGNVNLGNVGVAKRSSFLSETLADSVRYLEEAEDYNDFMRRVGEVEATWNSIRGAEKEVRDYFRQLNKKAREIRARLMED